MCTIEVIVKCGKGIKDNAEGTFKWMFPCCISWGIFYLLSNL